jgi:hypothetical protein
MTTRSIKFMYGAPESGLFFDHYLVELKPEIQHATANGTSPAIASLESGSGNFAFKYQHLSDLPGPDTNLDSGASLLKRKSYEEVRRRL